MIVKTWLPVYESSLADDIIERESEWLSQELEDSEFDELYSLECYQRANEDTREATIEAVAEAVETELKDFVKNITMEDLKGNVEIELTKNNVKNIQEYINANMEKWEKYLKEHYSSYDGFMSYYSSDTLEWEIAEAVEHDHKLGRILQFIWDSKEFRIWEYIDSIFMHIPPEQVRIELKENGFYEDKPELLELLKFREDMAEVQRYVLPLKLQYC